MYIPETETESDKQIIQFHSIQNWNMEKVDWIDSNSNVSYMFLFILVSDTFIDLSIDFIFILGFFHAFLFQILSTSSNSYGPFQSFVIDAHHINLLK
jgi:hypothetical protein